MSRPSFEKDASEKKSKKTLKTPPSIVIGEVRPVFNYVLQWQCSSTHSEHQHSIKVNGYFEISIALIPVNE